MDRGAAHAGAAQDRHRDALVQERRTRLDARLHRRTRRPEAEILSTTLDRRTLNRALLARQLLLQRAALTPAQALERLVGLQAQSPRTPYVGLWTRLDGFRPEHLERLIAARRAVRIALMRSTIHLVTARDALGLRPLVQPAIERSTWGGHGRQLAGIDRDMLATAARDLLRERPLTFNELGARLRRRWRSRDAPALAQAVRAIVPLVQVPPRGLWTATGPAAHGAADDWLAGVRPRSVTTPQLITRYLAAFGPATIADVQAWSGLGRLCEPVESLRRRLRVFRGPRGEELFDVPDAPRPGGDTPAPPRFLPEFDNLLLSHADRTRVFGDVHRTQVINGGIVLGTVLVDGFVAGRWRIARERRSARLAVEAIIPMTASDRARVADEGARLLAFAGGSLGAAGDVDVRRVE